MHVLMHLRTLAPLQDGEPAYNALHQLAFRRQYAAEEVIRGVEARLGPAAKVNPSQSESGYEILPAVYQMNACRCLCSADPSSPRSQSVPYRKGRVND